jgi:hypothetical protein
LNIPHRHVSIVVGGAFAERAKCCGRDSTIVLDLTSFKDKLPDFYGKDFGPRANIEVLVRDSASSETSNYVAFLPSGYMSSSYGTQSCKSHSLGKIYELSSVSSISWFGTAEFEDDLGDTFDDYSDSGYGDYYNSYGSTRANIPKKRPWLPRLSPCLHYVKEEGRLELRMGFEWGGKSICEKTAEMGRQDVLTFLDRCITWKKYPKPSNDNILTSRGNISDHIVSPKRTPRQPQPPRDKKRSDKESVEETGWSTYEYDLEDILPSYTFLVDLYEKMDGTSQEGDRMTSITVAISATTEPKHGILSLNVIDKDDTSKLTTWLSTRKNSSICGMVTVIERETGEQVQLFVGDVSKEKSRIGGGFKYFEPFSVLRYFSTKEPYSKVIWPESFLRISNAGVGFELVLYWFDSKTKEYHKMEDHLIKLFFKHGITFS